MWSFIVTNEYLKVDVIITFKKLLKLTLNVTCGNILLINSIVNFCKNAISSKLSKNCYRNWIFLRVNYFDISRIKILVRVDKYYARTRVRTRGNFLVHSGDGFGYFWKLSELAEELQQIIRPDVSKNIFINDVKSFSKSSRGQEILELFIFQHFGCHFFISIFGHLKSNYK